MKKRKALITGISGQDGAYLSDFLIKKIMKLQVVKGKMQVEIFGD